MSDDVRQISDMLQVAAVKPGGQFERIVAGLLGALGATAVAMASGRAFAAEIDAMHSEGRDPSPEQMQEMVARVQSAAGRIAAAAALRRSG